MKNIYITLIFILLTTSLKATTLEGIIYDSKTQTPVPYANVFLNQYAGTISDINGKFTLFIKNYNSIKHLSISCIGYNQKVLSLNNLDTIGLNKIDLIPVIYNLSSTEIISSGVKPYDLLQSAFDKIKENFKNEKHYLKGSYYEQINNFDPINKWHSRTLNSAVIIEDPGYDRLHGGWFSEWSLSDKILEIIYILGIRKGNDSLVKVPAKDGNYLTWTFEENYCRYKNEVFSSPKTYNYEIKSSYFDSILKTNIIEIKITPKDPKKEFAYAEVYISSSDHKIFKIHRLYKNEDYPIPPQTNKSDKDYYYHLNSNVIFLYKPDNEGKMILSYAKYEFGEGFFYYNQNKPHIVSKVYAEYKTIGLMENGEAIIKKTPRMDKASNIYDQKIMNNKAFWLDYNIILK